MSRAGQIQQYAKGTFGIGLAVDALVLELRLLMEQIEFIEEQVVALDEAIEQVLDELRAEHVPGNLAEGRHHVIETIPGIGPVLAAAIIGEIGDIRRFPNARKLVAYAGIDATTRQSGQFIGTRSRMSKRGSPHPRRVVWSAAISARRFHPQSKAY